MTPEELERAIARLFEGQDLLTGKVSELTEDVAALTRAVSTLTGDVAEVSDSTKTLRDEAIADRTFQREAMAEMRTAVGTMLEIAESMAANVTLLTQAQQATSRRVDAIEARLDER